MRVDERAKVIGGDQRLIAEHQQDVAVARGDPGTDRRCDPFLRFVVHDRVGDELGEFAARDDDRLRDFARDARRAREERLPFEFDELLRMSQPPREAGSEDDAGQWHDSLVASA